MAAFEYSNQSKIFRERTASKFQGQHAKQFNRCEGLCLATKTEIHQGFSMEFCKILGQLVSRIIFAGYFWKEKRGGEGHAVTFVVSGFHFFQGSYLSIKPWSNVLSPQILVDRG